MGGAEARRASAANSGFLLGGGYFFLGGGGAAKCPPRLELDITNYCKNTLHLARK